MFKKVIPILFIGYLFSQTTGKISGSVTDRKNVEPLPGVNIYLENTSFGTASDANGNFTIINIPPGKYTLKADMIGYKSVKLERMNISVNRTVSLKIEMDETVLEGEVVTVEVSRVAQKKDQTGTIKNISGDEINALPVESVGSVINMQAGVVNGHFRGGRNTEVTYMIDGVQVDETFGGNSAAVEIQPEAVQDLEVITGTFNAEYGRAMSGVVNVVTRDGGPKFEGFASTGLSFFQTPNTDIFIGLSPELNRSQDLKFSLGGPLLGDKITFFTNIRVQDNRGHLNGYRMFSVIDTSNFYSDDPSDWASSKSGDSSYVPMNTGENLSALFKLSFNLLDGIRFSLLHSKSDDSWFGYDHGFKYNPDGRAGSYKETNYTSFQLNHMINPKLFYELKVSYLDNYTGNYLFKDPFDHIIADTAGIYQDGNVHEIGDTVYSYIHDKYLENYGSGFFTGGQQKNHSMLTMLDKTIKFDLNWQANHNHNIKLGLLGISHDVDQQWHAIRNKYDGEANLADVYEPEIFGDTTVYADLYKVAPQEGAAYLQDKMEFDNMVVNVGLRYDVFDPASVYPSNRRNPSNQLLYKDTSGVLIDSLMS
ncbi:uncharacterized protein METZ01_LOCUS64095, partial [marine metagenome]